MTKVRKMNCLAEFLLNVMLGEMTRADLESLKKKNKFRTKSLSLAENRKAEACALLTATLKYFHGFLTCTDGEYACDVSV